MNIRQATPADIPQMCALLNEIINIGGTTAYLVPLSDAECSAAFLTGEGIIACHVCEQAPVGILGFQALYRSDKLPGHCADIATFARVKPKVKGVGTALFAVTRKFAEAAGVDVINATIRADNVQGLAYYAKIGFVDYQVDKAVPLHDGTPVDRISRRYDVKPV